jgi:hypothetical protein
MDPADPHAQLSPHPCETAPPLNSYSDLPGPCASRVVWRQELVCVHDAPGGATRGLPRGEAAAAGGGSSSRFDASTSATEEGRSIPPGRLPQLSCTHLLLITFGNGSCPRPRDTLRGRRIVRCHRDVARASRSAVSWPLSACSGSPVTGNRRTSSLGYARPSDTCTWSTLGTCDRRGCGIWRTCCGLLPREHYDRTPRARPTCPAEPPGRRLGDVWCGWARRCRRRPSAVGEESCARVCGDYPGTLKDYRMLEPTWPDSPESACSQGGTLCGVGDSARAHAGRVQGLLTRVSASDTGVRFSPGDAGLAVARGRMSNTVAGDRILEAG